MLAAVERLLAEGEPDVQGSVRCFIQTLHNQTCDTPNAHPFRRMLGTRSGEHWDDFERYLQARQAIDQWRESQTGSFPHLNLESIKDQELRDRLQHFCEVCQLVRRARGA